MLEKSSTDLLNNVTQQHNNETKLGHSMPHLSDTIQEFSILSTQTCTVPEILQIESENKSCNLPNNDNILSNQEQNMIKQSYDVQADCASLDQVDQVDLQLHE